jgi:hypothetical protein
MDSTWLVAFIRWAVFAIGLVLAFGLAVLLLTNSPNFGSGWERARNVALGGLGYLMVIGALLQHPLGWNATTALVVLDVLEGALRFRWIAKHGRSAVLSNAARHVFLLFLLWLLVTPSGRMAFGFPGASG